VIYCKLWAGLRTVSVGKSVNILMTGDKSMF